MNEEEIEKELEQLPKEWQMAFAARIAAQCLPALIAGEKIKDNTIGYWPKEDRSEHLFALLKSQVFSAVKAVGYDADNYNTGIYDHYITVRRIARATVRGTLQAAFDAGYNLYNKFDRRFDHPYAYAARAVRVYDDTIIAVAYDDTITIAEAVARANDIDIDIAKKIFFLQKAYRDNVKSVEYLWQPLCSKEEEQWIEKSINFINFLRGYGEGFDFWADRYESWLEGIAPDMELLKTIAFLPQEIIAQKPAHINAYLKSLDKAAGALNRVRVIFLGYGEAGKTSLIRALNGLEVTPGKEKMTPGIDISNWKVPDTEITAHFWDFGGQVVAHATHQFFLRSRCLYVLLLDGRTEINANEQAEYWLEHVRAFGNKAPVMLVGNKADLCAVNLDMARLKEKHPNVIGFYPLSCTQYQNQYALEFQRFQKDLSKEVAELGVHTVRFGKAHLAVLDELTERSGTESFLPKTDWLDLCADKGLAEQGDLNQAWLLDLFDKLGVIVHFPKLAALDSYILNPRWLTYGVYTLLYSKEAKEKKGRLQESEIIRILSKADVRDHLGNILSYPQEKAWIVLKAMEEFDLSFPCRHEPNMIIIPALLDSDQPKHGFDKDDSLAFEFDFTGFLPRHIMPNFIVGRHDEIKGELVWQNGVVLQCKDESAEALVQVDYHDRKLALWLRGPKANDYFKILYDDLGRILKRMPELRFEEFVIVPESSRIGEPPLNFRRSEQVVRADFQDLLALEENNGTEYICKAGKFDLGKILQIMPREARPAYQNENSGKTIYHIGKMEGDIMSGEAKKNGSNYTVGNIGDGSNVVVGSNEIKDSFYAIAQSAAEPALKAKLEELCQQVEQMLPQLPEAKREEAAQDLDSLVKEVTKESPRRKWYELSAEGLIEAAKACAGMAAPVTATIKGILALLKAT